MTSTSRDLGDIGDLTVDKVLKALLTPLLPDELNRLESSILREGCRDPLLVWNGTLVDGHHRYEICRRHGVKFQTRARTFESRDHAMAWMCQNQLGRRNLSDDQRAVVANDLRKVRSLIAVTERAQTARAAQLGLSAKSTDKPKTKRDTRAEVAMVSKLSEKKLRHAQQIEAKAPEVYAMVRAGIVTLLEGRKLAAVPDSQRCNAIKSVRGCGGVRSAIRAAKKEDYNARVKAAKPKALEGTYRIIYADPPWKYVGQNQADEYGHSERHYDCLNDRQLCEYRPGDGRRLVRDMADKDAVLFLWVTSPMLIRCAAIIEAWGFDYKASFVWDKVQHNVGHYNSVRHELLLICTRGSCKPDVPKLIDSVQSIERSRTHSEKPVEFYQIIEGLYDHGRKIELFARTQRNGWDSDGNESNHARAATQLKLLAASG